MKVIPIGHGPATNDVLDAPLPEPFDLRTATAELRRLGGQLDTQAKEGASVQELDWTLRQMQRVKRRIDAELKWGLARLRVQTEQARRSAARRRRHAVLRNRRSSVGAGLKTAA
ncbi:hypothetical protein ACIGXM_14440 [Kitasatospora sp. NPDC052896]|uniref:hypothetical protein n=1 Tax=Kitasatospora sp. NPDC052896 TaxID=3364061 RepID=UPI0037C91155